MRILNMQPNTACTERTPADYARAGDGSLRVFTCACGKVQASRLPGLELIPLKWRYLVQPTSGYPTESLRDGRKPLGGMQIYRDRLNKLGS
jgi:hypothetical protein